jgi:hypothetical protein
MKSRSNNSVVTVAIVVTSLLGGWIARADIVYRASGIENNFVPVGEDGTPGRPVPGDMLGNTITLAGTSRSLGRITVDLSINNAAGTPSPATDTWTVHLYLNDGPIDPASGLMQPSTLIACASTDVMMPPFTQTVAFDFGPAGVVVPDTFTVVIASTHPVDTWFQPAGVVGPNSSSTAPNVGIGPNTLWYTSAAAGWETNSTWAIADGATTNYMFMTVEASPVVGSSAM